MFLKFGFDLFFSYFCENLSFMNSNIYLLREKIETNPEIIADIDWRKETNGFYETMLDELVMSIDDDELNELVRESVINQWYLATNNASWPIADCDFDLTKMYDDGYGRLDRGYRYNTEKDDLDYINSIEEHLGTSNEKRIKKRELEKINNLLQKKALELARKKKSVIQPTQPQQVCGEDKAMKEKVEALTLELRKKQKTIDSLKLQLEELRKCHNGLKEEYDAMNEANFAGFGQFIAIDDNEGNNYIIDTDSKSELERLKKEKDEQEKQKEILLKEIKGLKDKLSNETVRLKVIADGIKDRAEMYGVQEAGDLFDKINSILVTVPIWADAAKEIKKFFKECNKHKSTITNNFGTGSTCFQAQGNIEENTINR